MAEEDNFSDPDEASMDDDGEEGSSINEGTEDDTEDGKDSDFIDDDAPTRFGHLQRSVYLDLSPPDQIAKWHDSLLPVEVDLITELDGVNLFFINVESMIIDLLLSKEVAFAEDPQFLRMVFAMEQLLYAIKACGGCARLVFFDKFKKVLTSAFGESVWAFRQAFLCHCKTSGIDHSVFSHWYSSEWKEHVSEWRPSFFLVANDAVELEDEEDEEEDEDEKPKDEKPQLREMFRALMLSCLSAKTHAALLRGVQRRGNRMMAFMLEPDCYDSWVDHNVQADLLPVFEEDDEDEEEEEQDVLQELQKFKKDVKVDDKALLRSFFTVKFCRETLKMVTGANAVNDQLMSLVVKTLVLNEIMLRQIPLDKRAYSVPAMEDWELYENTITAGLERFHTMAANSLAKLEKADVPEDLKLESCDLFDGRLYRFIFSSLVAHGLKNDGKVAADFFKFAPFVQEELDVIWKEAGMKSAFFPVEMTSLMDFPGIEPPELPAQEKPRPKPVLQTVDNDFLNSLWKDAKFGTVEEGGSEEPPEIKLFDETHKWNSSGYLDSLKEEEFMEENEAEKKFKAKMAAKGQKMTARDVEWQRKFQLKKKQMALKALASYAKSLTGSDKLHPPIIMKEETAKDKKEDEKSKVAEPAAKKVSGKHAELLEKRAIEEEAKIKAHDAEQLKSWDKTVDSLAEVGEPERFEKELLDCVCGFGRITDSIAGFPAVQNFFKTRDAQAKLVVKVVKACRTSFKKMQLDRLPASSKSQVRRIVRYFFVLLEEGFSSYGKSDLDGKSIKLFQECLIAIGFPTCAKTMFELWKEAQLAKSAKAAEEAQAAADPKGGKDDKKAKAAAKKDDKKEPKKDDKKDKKDDKKDKKGKASDEPEAGGDKDVDSFEVKKEVEKLWSGVGGDEMAFQLEYNGPYMTRTVGTAKDPLGRVSFKPDGWQKDLLDIVDKDESALIVAPTASGKTFIGYYVMDKVLRADNEGVAVYVAPSKALVNQVSAEVYARFSSKTYPAHSKNELLGCFLREYNSAGGVMEVGKWKNCQVLVTIPHILEMILLSPNMQDWVKRLRYIIFDEVHCIGEQEGGAQWEHTMQAIPCPFIALSATVADPSFFHGWLNSVCKAKGQAEVRLVKHTERWNDLYKYVFTGGQSRPLHPFCCLIVQSVRRNGFASDLTLTPQETCQLFFEVDKIIGKKHKTWSQLSPSKYWTGLKAGYLKKSDVRQYEGEVKALFLEVLRDGTLTNEDFEQLVLSLQNPADDSGAKADDKKFSPPPRAELADAEEVTDFRSMNKRSAYLQGANILKLCKTLDESEPSQLPALIFNFSTKDIDTMLKRTVKEMKDQQWHKYYGDEDKMYKSKREMERRMAAYNSKMTAYEQSLKANASKNQESNAARKEGGDEGRGGGKEANDTSLDVGMMEPEVPLDIADEIDMEFSFHSPKALGQWQEDIKDTIANLKRRKIPQVLIDGLQRGIGMHHEGCRTNYRQAVEILFRRGYLRVVFATGTLALGINMPCRTAIFCGDSLDLNGLMFRQMAGRAGRRGFDLLGQVVFLDMSFLKVRRLVASDLSTLTGEFQLSSTTLLRVLDCWEHLCTYAEQDKTLARSKEDVTTTFSPMYSLPFFKSDTADLDTQVKYHTRFSVELLRKEGLLNKLAFPSGLQSFVSHMFEVEPANLILARLIGSGLMHEYLKAEETNVIKGERRTHLTVKLMSLLGWFFFRRRLPATYAKAQSRKKWLPSQGAPRLPPLPPKILEEVQKYNAGIFELFQQLSWSVACTRKFRECDFMLPCSQRQFPTDFGQAPMEKDSAFQSGLIGQRVRFKARSPLAAISGGGDYFRSPNDLVMNLRNVIQMDMNALPIVPPAPGQDGDRAELEDTNSWALDYMIHGKTKYLWEDNAIDSTRAYKLISSFRDKAAMMVAAIKAYSPPADDIVLKTFVLLHAEMAARLAAESKGS